MRTFLLFCFLSFQLCAQNGVYENNQKILWELSHKDNPNIKHYLFASFPSNDKRVFDFPDTLFSIMKNVHNLLVDRNYYEDFIQADSRRKFPKMLIDNSGTPYSFSSEGTKTYFGDEWGMPQFLEMQILEYMSSLKKRILHLNKQNSSQFWNEVKDYKKNIFVSNNLDYRKEQFLQLYLKKDIYEIDRFLQNFLSRKDSSYFKYVEGKSMQISFELPRLIKDQKSTLILIGVQYFGGENGIIANLRRMGFVLRPVSWEVTPKNKSLVKEMQLSKKVNYFDTTSFLHIEFPGTPFIKYQLDGSKNIIYRELGQGNSYFVDIIPRDQNLSEEQIAAIYIQSPSGTFFKKSTLDNGTVYFEGLSETYQFGFYWVRIFFTENHFAVCKAFGGNLFLNSQRPFKFFNSIWFEF